MSKPLDIAGQKFGRLTAIRFSHKVGKRHFWLFRCKCGNKKAMNKSEVRTGHSVNQTVAGLLTKNKPIIEEIINHLNGKNKLLLFE